MAEDHRPGAVYWIDHYVVGTNNLAAWSTFYTNILGAVPRGDSGRNDRPEDHPRAIFTNVGQRCHLAGFVQDTQLSPSKGIGGDLPRQSWFIRPEDIEEHLRRLDHHGVQHTDAMRTSAEGQDGRAIDFEDPDGNQVELWAPIHLPEGAMDGASSAKIGKICSVVQESRDLQRTADFYTRFCGVEPIFSADIPKDTLAFALEGGGRLVFKQVDTLSPRTGGHSQWSGLHSALVIPADEFMRAYERMWAALPEEESGTSPLDDERLPARTGYHGNPSGRDWLEEFGRGDNFYDWDTNAYHFVAGIPVNGEWREYTSRGSRAYIAEHAAARGR